MVDCGVAFAAPISQGIDLIVPISASSKRCGHWWPSLLMRMRTTLRGRGSVAESLNATSLRERFRRRFSKAKRLAEPGAPEVPITVVPRERQSDRAFRCSICRHGPFIPESWRLRSARLSHVLHSGDWKIDAARHRQAEPMQNVSPRSTFMKPKLGPGVSRDGPFRRHSVSSGARPSQPAWSIPASSSIDEKLIILVAKIFPAAPNQAMCPIHDTLLAAWVRNRKSLPSAGCLAVPALGDRGKRESCEQKSERLPHRRCRASCRTAGASVCATAVPGVRSQVRRLQRFVSER